MLAEDFILRTIVPIHNDTARGEGSVHGAELDKDGVILSVPLSRFLSWRSPVGESCSLVEVQGKATGQVEAGASVMLIDAPRA